jgi:tetratricopeptide (TPR) repeat protein
MNRAAMLRSLLLATMLCGLAGAAVADDRAACERETGGAALAACTRAIESGQYAGVALAKLHTDRGVELKRKGDLDAAIADYDRAIALNAQDMFAYNNRGNAWRDKGDLTRALADYTAALRIDPDYAAAYTNRGRVHELRRDAALARTDYTAALAAPTKYGNTGWAKDVARQRLRALVAAP